MCRWCSADAPRAHAILLAGGALSRDAVRVHISMVIKGWLRMSNAPDLMFDMFDPSRPPADRRRSQIAFGGVVLLIASIVLVVRWTYARDTSGVHDRKGDRVELSALWRERRVLVMLFADRTCRECREELQQLQAHQAELGVPVIAISSDTPHELDKLRRELALSFELYSDPKLAAANHWRVPLTGLRYDRRACDALLLVEKTGQVSYRAADCGYPELPTLLTALRAKSPP